MASTKAKIGFIKGSSNNGSLVGATAINPTGTYNKFYFNTSLSVEEVMNIIKQLNYVDYDVLTYGVFISETKTKGLFVVTDRNSETSVHINYSIVYMDNEQSIGDVIFKAQLNRDESIFSGSWVITDKQYNFDEFTGTDKLDNIPIGQQNELLKNLISATPFESGSSNGIIEVDTLPTENINTKAIYKTPEKFTDLYIVSDTMLNILLSNGYEVSGTEIVSTKPTSNIVESTTNSFYLYYVTSENDVLVYINVGAGASWYSASQILELNQFTGLSFKGDMYENNIPTEIGYYAYYEKEKYYKYKNNSFVELAEINDTFTKLYTKQKLSKLEVNYERDYSNIETGSFTQINADYIKVNMFATTSNVLVISNGSFSRSRYKTIYIKSMWSKAPVKIEDNAFWACSYLTKLVLDFSDFEVLPTAAFKDTPIADGTGYIYVPDDKVNEVKALSGWSNYASQIKPLSEYKED